MAAMVAFGVGHFKVVSGSANMQRKAAAMLVSSERMMAIVRDHPKEAFCAHVRLDGNVRLMPDAFKAFPARTDSQERTEKKYGPVISKKVMGGRLFV